MGGSCTGIKAAYHLLSFCKTCVQICKLENTLRIDGRTGGVCVCVWS